MQLQDGDFWPGAENDFLLADIDEDFDEEFDEYFDDEAFPDELSERMYESEIFDDLESELDESPEALAEALREVLHEDYTSASPDQLEEALHNMWETMTPAEAFNFMKILKSVKNAGQGVLRNPVVGQIAQTALPIAGAAVGTYFGGPIGTALGTKLGQAAGSAFGGGSRGGRAAAAARPRPAVSQSPQAGSAAAAQLLQLTRDPNMLKSLLALALGAHGRASIPVAGTPAAVPVGAFMNLLGSLAGKAAADSEALAGEHSRAHSIDSEGAVSPMSVHPDDSADALYDLLADAEDERLDPDSAAIFDDGIPDSDSYFDDDEAEADYRLRIDGDFAGGAYDSVDYPN